MMGKSEKQKQFTFTSLENLSQWEGLPICETLKGRVSNLSVELKERIAAQVLAIKTGLILPHDDIAAVVAEAVHGVVDDGDIVCVTEAVVARSQNRYQSCQELA